MKVGWDSDFGKLREKLLAAGLKDIAAASYANSSRRSGPRAQRNAMRHGAT